MDHCSGSWFVQQEVEQLNIMSPLATIIIKTSDISDLHRSQAIIGIVLLVT